MNFVYLNIVSPLLSSPNSLTEGHLYAISVCKMGSTTSSYAAKCCLDGGVGSLKQCGMLPRQTGSYFAAFCCLQMLPNGQESELIGRRDASPSPVINLPTPFVLFTGPIVARF